VWGFPSVKLNLMNGFSELRNLLEIIAKHILI
jgi:hypothetical protein